MIIFTRAAPRSGRYQRKDDMSRAFVKEGDTVDELPDRLISEHANLVTPAGLAQIEAAVQRFDNAHAAAQVAGDLPLVAATARDLRYWSARLGSAELVSPPTEFDRVQFGSTVTIEREDGRHQTFRIVGEDEADPASGSISYVAPLARQLLGKGVGDTVRAGGSEAEIVAITG